MILAVVTIERDQSVVQAVDPYEVSELRRSQWFGQPIGYHILGGNVVDGPCALVTNSLTK